MQFRVGAIPSEPGKIIINLLFIIEYHFKSSKTKESIIAIASKINKLYFENNNDKVSEKVKRKFKLSVLSCKTRTSVNINNYKTYRE